MFSFHNKIVPPIMFSTSFNVPTDIASSFRRNNGIFFDKCLLFNVSYLGLIMVQNHLFKVSMVNFSSTENNSDSEEDFSRVKTEVVASFN